MARGAATGAGGEAGAADPVEAGVETTGVAFDAGAVDAEAGAGAEVAADALLPAASTCMITEPCLTLSPTLTEMVFTTPACEEGISIEDLSDSTVIRLCSALTVSPTATRTSITSTESKSPMSGI